MAISYQSYCEKFPLDFASKIKKFKASITFFTEFPTSYTPLQERLEETFMGRCSLYLIKLRYIDYLFKKEFDFWYRDDFFFIQDRSRMPINNYSWNSYAINLNYYKYATV